MPGGLVAYEGDSDSGDDIAQKTDTKLKVKADNAAEPRLQKKSQIIIKRPKIQRPKGHVSIGITQAESLPTPAAASTSTATVDISTTNETDDSNVERIRAFLRPPPVPGVDDWGIPPAVTPEESMCDPAVEAKLNQFLQLKSLPVPKHFNDTLMSNRSFRNPHLYAQMVEFIDIDERSTNFPKQIWDPDQVRYGEWNAEKIATYQKTRSEQQSQQSKA
ncbi:HCNGP-like protein-domain-containing protein, partial [Rhodocollybia butyracea]